MRTNPSRNDYLLAARRCVDFHSLCVYHARRNRLLDAPEWAAMWLNTAAQHRRNYQRRMQQAANATH